MLSAGSRRPVDARKRDRTTRVNEGRGRVTRLGMDIRRGRPW